MHEKVSQRKLKRACIDCHFFIGAKFYEVPDIHDAIPPQLNCYGTEHYELEPYDREQFRNKDFSRFTVGNLACYFKCWQALSVKALQNRYKTIVETNRNDCPDFFEYTEGMAIKTAIRHRHIKREEEKLALLQLKPNKNEVNKTELEAKQQEVKSVETTLSYDKTTGRFRFGNKESIAISKTPMHKARTMAEKLMKWWMKGQPCQLNEFGIDPSKKTPTNIYDNISDIRKALIPLKVNMHHCSEGLYHPPDEPEHFNIDK